MATTETPEASDSDLEVYLKARSRLTDEVHVDPTNKRNFEITILQSDDADQNPLILQAARNIVTKVVPEAVVSVSGDGTALSMPALKYEALEEALNDHGLPADLPALKR